MSKHSPRIHKIAPCVSSRWQTWAIAPVSLSGCYTIKSSCCWRPCLGDWLSILCTSELSWLGFQNSEHLYLGLEAEKSKIIASADPVSGKGQLPGLQRAMCSLYPHTMVSRERKQALLCPFYKGTNPIHRSFTLMTQLLPKGLTS